MFINGIEVIHSDSFILGFIFCMISDVFFSIANYFLHKSFLAREERRFLQRHSSFEQSKEVE